MYKEYERQYKKRTRRRQGPDDGPIDHSEEFEFYSKCDGKPVEGFKQGNDTNLKVCQVLKIIMLLLEN